MDIPSGKISGNDIDEFFEGSIKKHQQMYFDLFAHYEPNDLFDKWKKLIRCIDELINIPIELTDYSDKNCFLESHVKLTDKDSLHHFGNVIKILTENFGVEVAQRFDEFSEMIVRIHNAFKIHRVYESQGSNITLNGTQNSIEYFQSRRLYLVTTLFLIPKIAKGTKKIPFNDLLNVFLYTVDSCLVGITSAYQRLLINHSIVDFEVDFTQGIGISNYDFTQLESFYLNPQRLSLLDQIELRNGYTTKKELLGKSRHNLFSFSEIADTMTLMQTAFQKYKIDNLSIFNDLNLFLCEIGIFIRDDYEIIIESDVFSQLQQKYPQLDLFNSSSDYFDLLSSISPFQELGNYYYSTVVLLNRFIYNLLSNSLLKNRKFQINSGFVFEERISRMLDNYGFRDTKITRINRKEFDVVTIKNSKIYNFQCKNNYYDIANVDFNYKLIAGINRRLCRYYEKALLKEKNREHLLIQKLGITDIEHFVISRFPVITRNSNVVSFNQIEDWVKTL